MISHWLLKSPPVKTHSDRRIFLKPSIGSPRVIHAVEDGGTIPVVVFGDFTHQFNQWDFQ